ncbi:MAG TPA: helix-hairpin-helix domain-containing protein [Bacteroidia bacterium]|nr:helix-hairpin-helix domain-containing protein [Bacteroidia bacterium]
MTTEAIADALKLTAQLMELHGENPFKVKALSNAAFRLDKTNLDLDGKSPEELEAIEGIGKGIAGKIHELQQTGTTKELAALLEKTPAGVVEMLNIKGIGPKKIALLWKELGIESPGELLYACNENRLVELKGFGEKTQAAVKKSLEFSQASKGKFHYADVEHVAEKIVALLKKQLHTEHVSVTGSVRRKDIIIESIEIVAAGDEKKIDLEKADNPMQIPVHVHTCSAGEFFDVLFQTTGNAAHFKLLEHLEKKPKPHAHSEEEIFTELGLQFIPPELREGHGEITLAKHHKIPALITEKDLAGVLHNHSTYSDGMNTLEEMALHCKENGYEYFGICDHSQSAFYANGLKADRVAQQHREIDELNRKLYPFRIFKGIESDILNDGSLDYPKDVLASFDFIVASVHSNLKMDKEKATARLLKAIENPYTRILGHPTGRLLLSREGYPVDHKKIIDACAANGVVIELNAHPYRLDIDWKWIPYCMEKGVLISINPDAHEKAGLDMHWGVCAARKGMLTKEFCLNAKSLEEFEKWVNARREM